MLFIIYISVLVYLLFLKKSSKLTWFIVACVLSLLSITTVFYADLDNYGPLFDYYNMNSTVISFSTTNFLWALFCKLFYFLGFNYRGMIIILIFINYYILHKAAQNFNCNENIFFGLFMIFPSIIQLVQFKFFTSITLVILGYSLLIQDKKYSIIKFLTLIGAAVMIHSSALLFLSLILVKKRRFNNKIFYSFAIIMFVIILTLSRKTKIFLKNKHNYKIGKFLTDMIKF